MRIDENVMSDLKINDNSLTAVMPTNWLKYLVNKVDASLFRKRLSPAAVIAENAEPFRDVGTALRRRFCRVRRN
jgi:hypothetical protein